MRPIDADALTDYLKCLFPDRGMWEIEGDPVKNAICETVVEAMEMVKNMETINPEMKCSKIPNNWIPVNERLPKESGVYYVTEKVYAVMDEKRQGKYKLVTDSATYDTNKKQWLKAKFLEVVAWMERTPWKGETK